MSRSTWYRKRAVSRETSPKPAIPTLKENACDETSPKPALFLSTGSTVVSPERKQGAFRAGACGEGHGENPSTDSARREESVSVDGPGCPQTDATAERVERNRGRVA